MGGVVCEEEGECVSERGSELVREEVCEWER